MLLPGISPAMFTGTDTGGGGGGGSGGGSPVYLQDDTASDFQTSPTQANASWTMNNGGTVSGTGLGSYTWLNIGAAGDYEVRATILTGGSLTTGATGVWQALSTTRTWSRKRSGVGASIVTLKIEVRAVASGLTVATATITLDAEVS